MFLIIILNIFMKYFIVLSLFLFTYMSLSLTDLLIIWFIMEIINFLFVCLLSFYMKNKKMIFFYFIIQIIASLFIVYSIIMSNLFLMNNLFHLMMIMSLMMKLSIPPFHLWLPTISIYMPWNMLFMLLTLQKITPFYMLSLIKLNMIIIYFILMLSSLLPPIMMFNLINFKMLFSYSSINQSSWMILLIHLKNIIWFKYFIFYIIILLNLMLIMYLYKMLFNLIYFTYKQTKFNLIFIMFMFNLAGMPPFSFFYMKWFSIYLSIYNSNMLIILIIMMISSLFMLYIYINMMINLMFMHKFNSKLIKSNFMKSSFKWYSKLMLLNLILSLILIII